MEFTAVFGIEDIPKYVAAQGGELAVGHSSGGLTEQTVPVRRGHWRKARIHY